jgi:hypothetical protein
MSMLRHRLQVLIDEDRHRRLEAEAARRGVPVAVLVREALDAAYPVSAEDRRAAAERVLGARPMPVPDVAALKAELADARARNE